MCDERKLGGCAADGSPPGAFATSVSPVRVRSNATTAWAANENGGVELVGGAAGGAHQVQVGVLFCLVEGCVAGDLVEGCVAGDGSGDGIGESGPEIGGQEIGIEAEIFARRHVEKRGISQRGQRVFDQLK